MPLDPDRWKEVERIFAASVDLEPAPRRLLLDRECLDAEVRREVERLLAHDAGSTGRVAGPIRDAMDAAVEPGARRERIGPYRIQRELGRGGMGAVFLASRDDEEYSKQVAIKLVPGPLAGDRLLQRFRAERQILATLEHANIARLLDGGAAEDGLPYLVMEYVEGEPIDSYCDRRGLGIEKRLQIFRAVCAAVQHAHRNLVVHRDIKPANILVTSDGEPKLLDFGIAKLLDADDGPVAPTQTAARLMTPEYASPEQVRGKPITTASDIYSLGVLLYELLTGRRPYRLRSRQIGEIARAITEQEPDRPSTAVTREPADTDPGGIDTTAERISRARDTLPADLRRRLAGDLDDIVLMALRKEPERRYASVAEFSEDIRRHLEGLPVRARKDTWGYRAAKFARRNPWGVAAASAILLLVAGSSVGFFLQARRIAGERDRALAAEATARTEAATALRTTDFLVDLFQYSDPAEARGREIPVREVLDRGAVRLRGELQEEPEVQARLMATVAKVYGSLGLYDDALPLAEEALAQRRQQQGDGSAEVARALAQVGGFHLARGEREDAERELQSALETQRALLGSAHDDIVTTLSLLGNLRDEQGRYDEAEGLHREALAMATGLHGQRDAVVGRCVNNLAQVLARKGAYAEAEKLHRQNLAMRRDLLGEDHPDVGSTLNSLGQLLVGMGRYDEAGEMLQEYLDISARLYGEDSYVYAVGLSNLAFLLKEKGESPAAEPLQQRAVEITRMRLGPEHPETLARMNNLANLYQDQGKYEEAERIHRELLEAHRRLQGEHHPETAGTMNNLGSLLWDMGRYDEAEPLFRETIAADLETFGPEHGYLAMDYSNLAVMLRDRGRAADRPEAEDLFRKSVEIAQKAYGEDHPNLAVNEAQFGVFLCRTGRPDEGEHQVREALRIFEKAHGPDHFQVDMARAMLGECLTVRGSYAEAEPLVVQGYEALRDKLGERVGVTRRARRRVIGLYEAWGKPARAATYRNAGGPG